jgi:hypothetical protein
MLLLKQDGQSGRTLPVPMDPAAELYSTPDCSIKGIFLAFHADRIFLPPEQTTVDELIASIS